MKAVLTESLSSKHSQARDATKMFPTRVLTFLISISYVFNQEVEFSLETIDLDGLEGSGCEESLCILKINNITDQLLHKIQDLEQQNEDAQRKINQVDEEAQRKIAEVNNTTERLLAKIQIIETQNVQTKKQNKHLQEELTNLQDELSKVKETTASQEACFEDITGAKCSGSKSGKVGIIEAIRVDGGWGSWSSWSGCSTKCEKGVQVRVRSCNNPAPLYGGKPCPVPQVEDQECQDLQVCCEDGWTPFGNHCYMLVETGMAWTQADEYCRTNYQANLASITSQQENEFVANLCKKTTYCWIGGTDAEEEGTWVWSDGAPWGYTNWRAGEPNNSNEGENYAHMYGNARNRKLGEWNDARLGDHPFVCKLLTV